MDYTKYKERDFIWIGRNDGLNNADKSDEIINVLSRTYDNKKLLRVLINYYKGLNIGVLEMALKNISISVFYRDEDASLMFNNKNEEINKVFSADFIGSCNSKAVDKAIKTLSRRIND